MTKHGLVFLGALLASTSLIATTGCGDENSGGSGGSGGSGASGGTGGTGGMGGSGGSGGSAAVDCDKYCTDIAANCTGENQQYADKASCMGSCTGLPADGKDGDAAGNTMQCRVYHTSAATGDPATHCQHGGPSGGATCGSLCQAFCSLAVETCPTQWPQEGECMTSCMGWTAANMTYNAANFTAGNTTECRLYHLTVAASDETAAATHCPHTIAMSDTCK
ncbi:hypothetical protein [Polyangium mundeleinium]|uniref:Uncharacterized protein n=1 Tax=Polyangium mundeleinium TaxID=2995306 RepID=A0ABT5EJW8_9BACT|nr:hypothetical protein [Polyangium mundeleinium]MDC0742130.1 hypothetical protein [Polyangium mundeleinium]